MADVYDLATGHMIAVCTAGLQDSDEALIFARNYAATRKSSVILDDEGREFLVGPRGGVRRFTKGLKQRYGYNR